MRHFVTSSHEEGPAEETMIKKRVFTSLLLVSLINKGMSDLELLCWQLQRIFGWQIVVTRILSVPLERLHTRLEQKL